jgi:hypothetical protein
MPSAQNGDPRNVSFPVQVSITSSSNTTPIVVQTNIPHGITIGSPFHVKDHNTNLLANGVFVAGPGSSASALALYTVSGIPQGPTAAGGATGTVLPLCFQTFNMISDGDQLDGSHLNPPAVALSDRTAWEAALGIGAYKLAAIRTLSAQDAAAMQTTAWYTVTPGSASTYTTGSAGVFDFTSAGTANLGGICGGGDGPNAGDVIDVSFDSTVTTDASSTTYAVALFYLVTQPSGGTTLVLPGSRKAVANTSAKNGIHLGGIAVVSQPGGLVISLSAAVGATGGGQSVQFYGDYNMTVRLWRPTSMPQ